MGYRKKSNKYLKRLIQNGLGFPLLFCIVFFLGLSVSELFEIWAMRVFQALLLLALVETVIAYSIHRCLYPFLISLVSVSIILYSYYYIEQDYWVAILFIGMIGMLVSALVNQDRFDKYNSQ